MQVFGIDHHHAIRCLGHHRREQFLLGQQRRFGASQRGDVGRGADHAQRVALCVAHEYHAAVESPAPAPLRVAQPMHAAIACRVSVKMQMQVVYRQGQIVRVNTAGPILEAVADLIVVATKHALPLIGKQHLARLWIPVPDAVAGSIQRR